MVQTPQNAPRSRATRGGTAARVLLIILGIILSCFGLLFTIASCSIMLDDGDMDMLFLLPFTLATLIGGVVIIFMQARGNTSPAGGPIAGDVRITSVTPIANGGYQSASPTDHQATPAQAVPQPVTSPEPASAEKAQTAEDVAHLVGRSDDLFATLRDLVRHESSAGSDKTHLVSMLMAASVLDWDDAPACGGGRLGRNTHYWIRLTPDGLTEEQYDTLISTEAALSVNQDLPDCRSSYLDSHKALASTKKLLRTMCDQRVENHPLTDDGLRACYRDLGTEQTPGEWVVRSVVANAAECLRTPFRVVYDLRCNVAEGIALVSLEIPRPRCMAIFVPGASEQAGLARAYALRLSTLIAKHAFGASNKISRVVVNCHEHDNDETLLSISYTQQVLDALLSVVDDSTVEDAFPSDESIRSSFGAGQWFEPVEPFFELTDSHLLPEQAFTYPELDEREASPEVQRTCGAKRISDLGINESAGRLQAWHNVRRRLAGSTEQAVQALVATRDSVKDITVVEACTRVIQALVDGSVEPDDTDALAQLFIDGAALDRAVARAVELLDDANGPEDPAAAAKILEDALAPIDNMGAYLDDETNVYRYFGSVSERIHHNLAINEGGRQIRLVPDAYFNAHSNASIALGMLGENERALAHADVCLRLAPTSTFATMRKVRILESQSRIYEAADLIKDALRHAVTPRDAAICQYRLAYMEWKLGREDLAAACYQRSLTWDTDMSSQAREELDDLINATEGLKRPTDEQADALLAREGIPLGCLRSDYDRTLAAAVACIDDSSFFTAGALMAVLYGVSNDDVVMGVYRSLKVTE